MRRIRELEARTQTTRIPAAALTAYAQESDTKKILAAGFDQHIPKPVTTATLLSVVRAMLSANDASQSQVAQSV
jgi:CheY-like chemotaxis protein